MHVPRLFCNFPYNTHSTFRLGFVHHLHLVTCIYEELTEGSHTSHSVRDLESARTLTMAIIVRPLQFDGLHPCTSNMLRSRSKSVSKSLKHAVKLATSSSRATTRNVASHLPRRRLHSDRTGLSVTPMRHVPFMNAQDTSSGLAECTSLYISYPWPRFNDTKIIVSSLASPYARKEAVI